MKGSPFQGHLASVVRNIFPNRKILTNARKVTSLVNPKTGKYLELDIIVPSLNICFEFQDIYHYTTTWYSQVPLNIIQKNDLFKSDIVRQSNYTLIVVPCWWDGRKESLIATIQFQRPELFYGKINFPPIPFNYPLEHFTIYIVPDVGEVMLASFASNFASDFISARNQWWVGEKYDGVRCIWNHSQKILYGRSNYLDSFRLLKSNLDDIEFDLLRVVVFDNPSPTIQTLHFEKRYKNLLEHINPAIPFLNIAVRLQATSNKQVSKFLQMIIYNGGEGLMLRKPKTLYEHGRSNSLVKLKVVRGDTEALVVGIDHPWCQLKLPSGIKFNVEMSTSTEELEIGDVVTLEFESFSKNEIPISPKISRNRQDLRWEEVMNDYVRDNHEMNILNKLSRVEPVLKTKTTKTGESKSEKEWREIFEHFARSRNFDPRICDTWYSMPYSFYFQEKDVRSVLRHFGGDFITALKTIFSELKFDILKFHFIPGVYWKTLQNRRDVFDNFSMKLKFNPTNPLNWYSVNRQEFVSKKAIMSLVNTRYGGQVGNALVHLYPDINLDKRKLNSIFYWNGVRDFFTSFATMKGFDYKIPENWYSVTVAEIWAQKDARVYLAHYKGNFVKTLIHVFPNIGLNESRFSTRQGEYWANPDNQRKFFERFAAVSKFDPFVAHNWYNVKRTDITSIKGAIPVLNFHDNNFVNALVNLFPEVSFDTSLFVNVDYWQNPRNRRKFFEDIAKENNFDLMDPHQWYPFTSRQIHQLADGPLILNFHRNSVALALIQLFPEISFDKSLFKDNFWSDTKNRILFFENFAKENKFDSLVADNWYKITQDQILIQRHGATVLDYHQNNFIIALSQLFPHLRFDRTQFRNNHWSEASNRKKFFNKIAYKNGIDAFSAEDWYSFNPESLLTDQDGKVVLSYYNNNFVNALRSLFRSIRFDSSKFLYSTKDHLRVNKPNVKVTKSYLEKQSDKNIKENQVEEINNLKEKEKQYPTSTEQHASKRFLKQYWTDESNRRNFFISFAKEMAFDPHVPENWYSYSYWDIRNQKKSSSVLSYYRGNHKTALLQLFPNIGLDYEKFIN